MTHDDGSRWTGGGSYRPDDAPAGTIATMVGEVSLVGADARSSRVGGRQPQLVLAYLLVEDRTVNREELAELLWGEDLPSHWAGAVRGVLSKVRTALAGAGLAPATLVVEGGTVRLVLPPGSVTDVGLAEGELDQARNRLEDDRADEAIALARAAARRLAGPFLADGDGDWVRRQQERVADLARRAASVEIEALLRSGRADEAAERAAVRVADDVFDERAHHLRIEALLASGRSSTAVIAYEQLADVLRTELGIAPSADTAALVATVRSAPTPGPVGPALPTSADRDRSQRPTGSGGRRPAWPATSGRFVGRTDELARLGELWEDVVDRGTPVLVVVGGHAGLGKTRVAAELCDRAASAGAQVLWGRCRPTSGIPYEPVVEALGEILATGDGVIDQLGSDGEGLVMLFPELAHRFGGARPPDDAAVARSQMLRSVVATLDAACAVPTVWVVDDLQWASADTMTLLEVILGAVARPLLVIATYRGRTPEADAGLARVQRLVPTVSVPLGGLDPTDVADLLRDLPATVDNRDDRSLARTLHERTNGHPFLVTEIIAEARRRGHGLDVDEIPSAARDWIERRVGQLPPEVAGVVHLASVIGLEVDLDLLCRVSADPAEVVLGRCERLVAEGLLVETDTPGVFAFPHRITREVIADSLSRSRRAVLHRTVGDALRTMPVSSGHNSSVAHHYHRAGPAFVALAAAHQIEAGREALAQSAWTLAAGLFDAAVGALRSVADEPGAVTLLADAWVGLGQARHRSGDRPAARAALEEAVALARDHDLPLVLAESALVLVGRAGRGAGEGMADAEQAALLREALAGLEALSPHEDDRTARRAALVLELEGELALALLFTDAVDEREVLTTRAVRRVRTAPQSVPGELARALLNARITKLDPALADDRLADLDEVLSLPAAQLSPEQSVAAVVYRHEELLRLGRRAEANIALARAALLADQHRHPYWQWAVRTWQGLGHLIDGDLDAAEGSALAAADLQEDAPEESIACLGVNLVSIRLLQGRAIEVLDLIGDAADRYPQIPCYRAVSALCATESGDQAGAAAAYRVFADRGFAAIPDDTNRFLTLAVLGHVAADLGDRDASAALVDLLEPYRALHVVLNCYGGGGTYWGPATYALARLAVLDDRPDDAAVLFRDALGAAEALGARSHLERIRGHAGILVG